jgi:hypothetical protein
MRSLTADMPAGEQMEGSDFAVALDQRRVE